MKVLLTGEDAVPGSGRYLIGLLRSLRADVAHVPSAARLTPRLAARPVDAVIISDFPAAHAPREAQAAIAEQVARGAGLLMVGGWGSFGGPFGRWQGTAVERLLPVRCAASDDRVHLPSGAVVIPHAPHPILRGLSWTAPPVICGLNRVRPVRASRVLLAARPIRSDRFARTVALKHAHPLLVIGTDPGRRTAAFTSDVAPHWCGGLVDWGARRAMLPAGRGCTVEVGDQYLRLFTSLLRWLGKR